MTKTTKLTQTSLDLFLAYAKDAGNWNGQPLVGGNVGGTKEERGNLTQLKKAGLIKTVEDDGEVWINFTEAGAKLAAEHGVKIDGFEFPVSTPPVVEKAPEVPAPVVETVKCPKCKKDFPKDKIAETFGFRTVGGKQLRQSYCRVCRNGKKEA